ncbi:hypothetical protein EJ03DRAFT_215521 [Teratosphaeria nubilosa]|uniref:Uncharacterized protein n=1 Tax=Teratosphaeria nubilosa TaxID=161662 RepID=A0A6G1LH38_9PEZI|nr:hypothetical protein EJ03DRAFT_215521 [Teratosphaeria nubilosa]
MYRGFGNPMIPMSTFAKISYHISRSSSTSNFANTLASTHTAVVRAYFGAKEIRYFLLTSYSPRRLALSRELWAGWSIILWSTYHVVRMGSDNHNLSKRAGSWYNMSSLHIIFLLGHGM